MVFRVFIEMEEYPWVFAHSSCRWPTPYAHLAIGGQHTPKPGIETTIPFITDFESALQFEPTAPGGSIDSRDHIRTTRQLIKFRELFRQRDHQLQFYLPDAGFILLLHT